MTDQEINTKKFVCIGHVDTGKSCLCGHLLYKCGYVDEHRMKQIRDQARTDNKDNWVWSRILDIYKEEMKRSKTHEFSSVEFRMGEKKYELIDTPGHKLFVRSMIEGISGDVNIAVLLLSMIENEFEASFDRGMLKEHLVLAKSVGIQYVIIVSNKMDVIKWDQAIYAKNVRKVTMFIHGTLGWPKENIKFVAVSALIGVGLTDLKGIPEEGKWYLKDGMNFLECLDSIPFDTKSEQVNEPKKSKKLVVGIKIVGRDELISAGYECMLHYGNKEIPMEIKKIGGKSFAKKGDFIHCGIELNESYYIAKNHRIILRNGENTIGFGTIEKVI